MHPDALMVDSVEWTDHKVVSRGKEGHLHARREDLSDPLRWSWVPSGSAVQNRTIEVHGSAHVHMLCPVMRKRVLAASSKNG